MLENFTVHEDTALVEIIPGFNIHFSFNIGDAVLITYGNNIAITAKIFLLRLVDNGHIGVVMTMVMQELIVVDILYHVAAR